MGKQIVSYEDGQDPNPFEAMTNSGDNTSFNASFYPISNKAGKVATVAPYGVMTGGVITVNVGTNDSVTVAALTASMAGATGADSNGDVSVSSSNVSITRGLTTDIYNTTSITVDSTGSLAAVSGIDGPSVSETRGATGGPPFIPVGSVEVGQVRTSSVTSGDVLSDEIFQVPRLHKESAADLNPQLDLATGVLVFAGPLPLIHTGSVPKQVWINGYTPLFNRIDNAADWDSANQSYSISSTDTYDGSIATSSASLGQASFKFQSDDGLTHPLLLLQGEEMWFEYRPNEGLSFPRVLTQGILGVKATFSVRGKKEVACTISPEKASLTVTS